MRSEGYVPEPCVKIAIVKFNTESCHAVHHSQLKKIEVGCNLFSHKAGAVVLTDLHPTLPRDIWYIPGDFRGCGSNNDEFMTLVFSSPATVFLLLPSAMTEPVWLRDHFVKFRDARYSPVTLKSKWTVDECDRMMMVLTNKWEQYENQRLRVYKSVKDFKAGDSLQLPGPGFGTMMDTMYILGFTDSNASAFPRATIRSQESLDSLDFPSWYTRLIKAVRRNKLEDVKSLANAQVSYF